MRSLRKHCMCLYDPLAVMDVFTRMSSMFNDSQKEFHYNYYFHSLNSIPDSCT